MKPTPGRVCRALRTTADLTQEHVARRADATQSWISQIERDEKTPSPAVERALALGRPAAGESEPSWALGIVDGGDQLRPLKPAVVSEHRDVARAVADLCCDLGGRPVAAFPAWRNYLDDDSVRLDDLRAVGDYLTAVSEGGSSRGTAVSGDLAATDHSAENP